MAYILRHNLTGIALEHLLKMFNEHFPGSMPATSYLFHKAYGQYGQYESHFYCSGCTSYIGKGNDQTQCTICNMPFDDDTNLKELQEFQMLIMAYSMSDYWIEAKRSDKKCLHTMYLVWWDKTQHDNSANCICWSATRIGGKWNKMDWHTELTAHSKVHALICSSDSVARAQICNTKQFNGEYGCDFCYHKGGPYSHIRPEPSLRSESEHFEHAMAATPQQPIMGVKGPSPLMKLSKFRMVNGFVPEYQHSVCLGVTRQLMTLWLDSKNNAKPWYIGTKSDMIDKQLLAIKPPLELTRVPCSVEEPKFWKASEWRSFLLFYALPVLSGILSKKYLNHLFLLVFGIYTLLQEKIQLVDIDNAEKALKKFVKEFEKLYGRENMTFNVHLITHFHITSQHTFLQVSEIGDPSGPHPHFHLRVLMAPYWNSLMEPHMSKIRLSRDSSNGETFQTKQTSTWTMPMTVWKNYSMTCKTTSKRQPNHHNY